MLAQIAKQISDNIGQSLAKHAPNLAQAPLKKGEQATFFTRFGNELAQNPQNQTTQKYTQSVFDFDFIARDKAPNFTPELPKNPNAELSQNPKTNTEEKHSFNPLAKAQADTGGGYDLARYQELESSLDSRFNDFDKQASDSAQDINKWFEAQRSVGNKEVLVYDKDLAEYRKLDDALRTEKQEKADKAYYKKATQEWLEKYKPAMIDKTDAEIIATQGKEAGKSYDEARHLLASMRKDIERNLDLRPIAEFGTNYAEFYQDGKGAIAKLIAEANAAKQAGQDFSGQVAGAFSKEIDGAPARIDLVWGKITNPQTHEGYGLAHIIDKHPELDLNLIPKIIEKGQIVENAGTKTIIYKTNSSELRVGLSKGFFGKGDNEWVITAYQKATPAQNFDQVASKVQSGNNLSTSGDNQIIQKISQKFNKDEKYAKNLYEWHKDSHPFTKEADGTPKVFYHGNKNGNDISIFEDKYEVNGWGSWLTPNKDLAKTYGHIQEVMISGKNFLDLEKMQQQNNLIDIAKFFELDEKIIQEEMPNINNLFGWIKEAQAQAQREYLEILDFSKNGAYIKGFNGEILLLSKEKIKKHFRDELSIFNELLNKKSKIYKTFDRLYGNDKWFRKPIDLIINLSPYGYYGQKRAKDFLKSKGYDGVKIDNNQIVVFDSNQIKEVGNKGTFDATNPNIYHSSSAAGGGLAGGTIAGVERDDEGNAVGFSPEKFALGFAAGASGAKALSSNFANKYAKIASQNATKGQGMQTLSKFIKDNELDYSQMGEISALPAMQKYKDFMDSFLNSKNIKKLSQNKIAMQTPAGEVKIYLPYAYGHFHKNGKFGNKKEKRNNLTGTLKEILTNPLFVTKDKRGSLYFYKPFRDKDNILDLISVSVDKEGKIQYKTTYADKYKQVLNLIKNNELVYIRS